MKWPTLVLVVTVLVVFLAGDAWAQKGGGGKKPKPKEPTAEEPVFARFDMEPKIFGIGVRTTLTLTAVVSVPPANPDSVRLERQQPDGSFKNFSPIGLEKTADPLVFTAMVQTKELVGGTIVFRLSAALRKKGPRQISPIETLVVGEAITAADVDIQDVTVTSSTDPALTVTLQQGSVVSGEDVFAAVEPLPTVEETLAGQPVEDTIDVIIINTVPEIAPLTAPVLLEIPAPQSAVNGDKFWLVRELVADSRSGGLARQFLTVDTGTALNGVIVTDNDTDPPVVGEPDLQNTNRLLQGIFGGGDVKVVKLLGSGAARGEACAEFGTDGIAIPAEGCDDPKAIARPHVWVKNLYDASDTLITDETQFQGFFTNHNNDTSESPAVIRSEYIVPIAGTKYQIEAIDGFRCVRGLSDDAILDDKVSLVSPGGNGKSKDTSLRIVLNTAHPATRFGIRNSGYELPFTVEKCTVRTGTVVRVTGGTSPSIGFRDLFGLGTTLQADEGDAFVAMRSKNASIEQEFLVPEGVDTYRYQFHFGCRASNNTCNTSTSLKAESDRLEIGLTAELILPANFTQTATDVISVTHTFGNWSGQVSWQTGHLVLGGIQVPNPKNNNALEPLPGSQVPITVKFTATIPDTATNVFDSTSLDAAVLLDNHRFQDVFITVTTLSGSDTTATEVREQVRALNVIGSQTGKNVQIRRIHENVNSTDTTDGSAGKFCNPDALLDLVNTFNAVRDNVNDRVAVINNIQKNKRTVQETALMCFASRLNPAEDPDSDIQVYYVKDFQESIFGIAITEEDYFGDDDPNTSAFDPPLTEDLGGTDAPSPTGFIVKDLTSLSGNDLIRFDETPWHELGHGGMSTKRVNDAEEHFSAASSVMTKTLCEPITIDIQELEDLSVTLCSSRPMLIGAQSVVFDPPPPPALGTTCLLGC